MQRVFAKVDGSGKERGVVGQKLEGGDLAVKRAINVCVCVSL